MAQEEIVLMGYGELPDEEAGALEQHLAGCESCQRQLEELKELEAHLAMMPVMEPSPNLVAQARMRLDDALDTIPPHGFLTRLRSNYFSWLGHVQSAPALATLLVGVGFLGGNFLNRYEVAHEARPKSGVVVDYKPGQGVVANVTGIERTPNSEIVQVKYTKLVPETMEGSLDEPRIRELLMMGLRPTTTNDEVRTNSVALLADECRIGHRCTGGADADAIRRQLMESLLYDPDPSVRLSALHGLESYVSKDQQVRDTILVALMHDANSQVRREAIGQLGPVKSDSSVRQVLRTVSTEDENPYIRTASFEALAGSADIQ